MISQAERLLWVDAVEKVGGTLTGHYNRIKTGKILNRYCVFGSSFESMLPGKASKSFFDSIGQTRQFDGFLRNVSFRCFPRNCRSRSRHYAENPSWTSGYRKSKSSD